MRIDDATEMRIEDRPGGFRIFVNRAHYQFFPDQAELRHACRTAITSLAHDHAAQQGRRLRPISQDRIRVDTGRNPLTATTFCSASATVEYE
jgi:hypothetical protein